jgi:hypothetical protein
MPFEPLVMSCYAGPARHNPHVAIATHARVLALQVDDVFILWVPTLVDGPVPVAFRIAGGAVQMGFLGREIFPVYLSSVHARPLLVVRARHKTSDPDQRLLA